MVHAISMAGYSSVVCIQDTKKCYVGRNGKRNQQKLHIQVCGLLRRNGTKGAKAKCAY